MGIFNKVKNAAMRKVMVSQMKKQEADDGQIKLITEMLEQNPDLFESMGKDIEEQTKAGKDQTQAAQAVMMKYQADLQKIMMKNPAMMQKMKIEAMKMQRQGKK